MDNNNDRVVEDVRGASDIVEIIGQFVTLKKAGRNFKGLCPFHGEKSPSFMVHPEKQIFHCFGCGVGGDVFSFLMRQDNMSFPEALRHLAERAHIAIPENAWKKSAGSVFKKLPASLASQPASRAEQGGQGEIVVGREGGAGRFIEQAGLKGKRIGGAEISTQHANFIINTGNATANDVRGLISLVQEKVKDRTGLKLETEISFVGEF